MVVLVLLAAGRQCLEAELEFYVLSHSGNWRQHGTGALGMLGREEDRKEGRGQIRKGFLHPAKGLAFHLAGAPGRCSAGEP